jgi:hypothetical protein
MPAASHLVPPVAGSELQEVAVSSCLLVLLRQRHRTGNTDVPVLADVDGANLSAATVIKVEQSETMAQVCQCNSPLITAFLVSPCLAELAEMVLTPIQYLVTAVRGIFYNSVKQKGCAHQQLVERRACAECCVDGEKRKQGHTTCFICVDVNVVVAFSMAVAAAIAAAVTVLLLLLSLSVVRVLLVRVLFVIFWGGC